MNRLLPVLVAQLESAGFSAEATTLDAATSQAASRGELKNELDILIGGWSSGLLEDIEPLFGTRSADGERGRLRETEGDLPDLPAYLPSTVTPASAPPARPPCASGRGDSMSRTAAAISRGDAPTLGLVTTSPSPCVKWLSPV